jgi:hypothetical protein
VAENVTVPPAFGFIILSSAGTASEIKGQLLI